MAEQSRKAPFQRFLFARFPTLSALACPVRSLRVCELHRSLSLTRSYRFSERDKTPLRWCCSAYVRGSRGTKNQKPASLHGFTLISFFVSIFLLLHEQESSALVALSPRLETDWPHVYCKATLCRCCTVSFIYFRIFVAFRSVLYPPSRIISSTLSVRSSFCDALIKIVGGIAEITFRDVHTSEFDFYVNSERSCVIIFRKIVRHFWNNLII